MFRIDYNVDEIITSYKHLHNVLQSSPWFSITFGGAIVMEMFFPALTIVAFIYSAIIDRFIDVFHQALMHSSG